MATNFAMTLDGRVTIDGRAGPIGTRADLELLQRLRTRGDAVMIGAGTLRVERYGRMVPDSEFRDLREADGLARDPLGIIVSGSLDLPWDAGLFTCGKGKVLVITTSDDEPPETETEVELLRQDAELDLTAATAELRQRHGIRGVVCEGGPTLHGNLIAEGLVDELFVTIAPKLAGPGAPTLVEAAIGGIPDLELVTLHEAGGELFSRWLVR
jgi:riboflavin-specific deaminase-like protein